MVRGARAIEGLTVRRAMEIGVPRVIGVPTARRAATVAMPDGRTERRATMRRATVRHPIAGPMVRGQRLAPTVRRAIRAAVAPAAEMASESWNNASTSSSGG